MSIAHVLRLILLTAVLSVLSAQSLAQLEQHPKPLMREFMGLCVHTVKFKPDLYKPICRHLRDYHNINWDLGDNPDSPAQYPFAANKVNWQRLYGSWREAGYTIDASLMFHGIEQSRWTPENAHAYGQAVASYFGPSHHDLLSTVEIGNEPGMLDDDTYRMIFEHMAKGLRAGDPMLRIATCATFDEPSGKYHKSLDLFKDHGELYDIINVHSYPQIEGWPTWRRSYPEDPAIDFLAKIQAVIDWRDSHAKGKPVWLTEFGYDATTQPNDKQGTFKDWVGVSDEQQARYIVRAFLVLASMDLDRAYLYWFNDNDKPSVHAASGLTRHYEPKPSYYAVAHLYKTLADYRFSKVIQREEGGAYIFEFTHQDHHRRVWVAWRAVGEQADPEEMTLPIDASKVVRGQRMPTAPGKAGEVAIQRLGVNRVSVELSGDPVYLFLR